MRPAPRSLRARDALRSKVASLQPDQPLEDGLALLEREGVSAAPVVDAAGRLLGVLRCQDLVGHAKARVREGRQEARQPAGEDRRVERVYDHMRDETVAVTPDATLAEVCATMVREDSDRLFVVEGGKLRGEITALDVVRALARG